MLSLTLLFIVNFIWLYFSIFCHEHGHFFCAKLVGLRPYLIRVGSSMEVSVKWLFKSKIVLGIIPSDGLTFALLPKPNRTRLKALRLRLAVYILGGCLANLILLSTTLSLYIYSNQLPFLTFSLIEGLMIVASLIPTDNQLYGVKFPTDGKQLISTITQDHQKYYENLFENYQKIILRYSNKTAQGQPIFNGDLTKLYLFMEAEIAIVHQNYDEAIVFITQLLNSGKMLDSEKAYLLDTLVSLVIIHGQKQYLPQADIWSQQAFESASYSKTIQGTRGAILVELGQCIHAKQLLLPLTKQGNEIIDITISSCYLAKAECYLGNIEKAYSWLKKAEEVAKDEIWFSQIFNRIEKELEESF